MHKRCPDRRTYIRLLNAIRRLDLDHGPGAAALFIGIHAEDSICIDAECHIDFRNTCRERGNACQLDTCEGAIIRGHFTLALHDVDEDFGLAILAGREVLDGLGWDTGVAVDEFFGCAADGLDAKGQRCDIEEQGVRPVAGEDIGLDGSAEGDDLVRVDISEGGFTEVRFHTAAHQRNAGAATDENNGIDSRWS